MAAESAENFEKSWLVRLQAGDRGAFPEFVEKYKDEVFMCCRCMGLDFNDAEDVASEVFLGAYRNIESFSGKSKLETWVWGITYRKAVSYLRKKKRYAMLSREIKNEIVQEDYHQGSSGLEHKEQAEIVWEMVRRLPKL